MFKKGDAVVYPKLGAGTIFKIYNEKIGGIEKKYYKIKFLNTPVDVAIPIDKAEELGLRRPLSKKEILEKLKILNKKVKIDKKTLITLDAVTKKKLNTGKFEDVIELVNILKSLAKQKEEENKNFSYSYSDRLEIATDFIKSEIIQVLGTSALKKFSVDLE